MPYKDPEKLRSYKADYARKRRENLSEEERQRIKQQRARYRRENRDKLATYMASYREKNKDQLRTKRLKYYAENASEMLTRARIYREANPERVAATNRALREEFIDYYRKRSRDNMRRIRSATPSHHGRHRRWSKDEDAVVLRDDITVVEMAFVLNRSYQSVCHRRMALRKHGSA